MDIVVVGKHGAVDAAVKAATVEKVERVAKFVKDVRRIDVDYAHRPTRRADDSHTCEILVHVRQHLVKGIASATEFPTSLDRALDKVEEQMRRLHGRRVGRRNGARARGARATAGSEPPAEPGEETGTEALVRTKRIVVTPMDVDEAALQMELLGHDFFLFSHADTGQPCVIYRRRDGQLGLIEATG